MLHSSGAKQGKCVVTDAIVITDVPKEPEIWFASLCSSGEVVLHLTTYDCQFAHLDGKISERIRLVHGGVNPTQRGENYARIPIHGAMPESSITSTR